MSRRVEVFATRLAGLVHFKPKVFGDSRGYFLEAYSPDSAEQIGIDARFVMDGESLSARGTLRGLHYREPAEAKLVRCVRGALWDVVVDLRPDAPTFGQWEGFELSEENHHQLFVPAGFAHGFSVLSESALMLYKKTELYDGAKERSLKWNDPQLGIDWRVPVTTVSPRDEAAESFAAFAARLRPPLG